MIYQTTGRKVIDSVGKFSSIDMTNDPRWFIDFMDNANCLHDHKMINQRITEVLAPLNYKHILELGCGTGNDARSLVKLHPEISQVVGVDLSEIMINEANSRQTDDCRVRFEQGDSKNLRFEDNVFDAARAKLVLMHCDNIDATLKELIRVTKPNGLIAVYDHDFDGLMVDHPNQELTRQILKKFSDKAKNNWSGRQLFCRFLRHGLINVTVETISVNLTLELLRFMILGEEGINNIPPKEKVWWDELASLHDQGYFFASFIGFLVVGTK